MPSNSSAFQNVWLKENKLSISFNTLKIDTVFREKNPRLIIGCEDGTIRLYDLPQHESELKCVLTQETKGGPIQAMVAHDVTRFGTKDVIVADSRGVLTIISNGQILRRQTLSDHCIKCLAVLQDATGNVTIVNGDAAGLLCGVSLYTESWKLRLSDLAVLKGLPIPSSVQCILSVRIQTYGSHVADYILATVNTKHLLFIQDGHVVKILETPAVITAMCSGKFLNIEAVESSNTSQPKVIASSASGTQVALGGEMGKIYIMNQFEIYHDEYADLSHTVTNMVCLGAADTQQTLVCSGHFNAVRAFYNGEEIAKFQTPNWVNTMTTADIDGDGQDELIIGCLDNSIHALRLKVS